MYDVSKRDFKRRRERQFLGSKVSFDFSVRSKVRSLAEVVEAGHEKKTGKKRVFEDEAGKFPAAGKSRGGSRSLSNIYWQLSRLNNRFSHPYKLMGQH